MKNSADEKRGGVGGPGGRHCGGNASGRMRCVTSTDCKFVDTTRRNVEKDVRSWWAQLICGDHLISNINGHRHGRSISPRVDRETRGQQAASLGRTVRSSRQSQPRVDRVNSSQPAAHSRNRHGRSISPRVDRETRSQQAASLDLTDRSCRQSQPRVDRVNSSQPAARSRNCGRAVIIVGSSSNVIIREPHQRGLGVDPDVSPAPRTLVRNVGMASPAKPDDSRQGICWYMPRCTSKSPARLISTDHHLNGNRLGARL